MELINLTLALAIVFLFGHALSKLLLTGKFRPFIAYGMGFGLITITMFYFSLLGIKFQPVPVIATDGLLLVLLNYFVKTPAQTVDKQKQRAPFTAFEIALLIFLVLNFLVLVFRTMYFEHDMWDSWSVWGFKAKIYYIHQIIPFERFREFYKSWGCWDYPHHVPLMESWIFLILKQWNDQAVRIIFPLFWLGILSSSYLFLREFVSRKKSLMAVVIISCLPTLQVWTMGGITESILIFYYISSFAYLMLWLKDGGKHQFILSALLAGLAAWTKNEGIVYTLFNIIILILYAQKLTMFKRILNSALYILIAFGLIWPWWTLKNSLAIDNILINNSNLSFESIATHFSKLPDTLFYFLCYFNNFYAYGVAWAMFSIFIIIQRRSITQKPACWLLTTLGLHAILIISFGIIGDNLYFFDAMRRLFTAPAILAVIFSTIITAPARSFPRPS